MEYDIPLDLLNLVGSYIADGSTQMKFKIKNQRIHQIYMSRIHNPNIYWSYSIFVSQHRNDKWYSKQLNNLGFGTDTYDWVDDYFPKIL